MNRARPHLTRREVLAAAGAVTAATWLGCGKEGAERSASPAARGSSCVLTPESTEGPYHIDLDGLRSDITEDREGLPLELALMVQMAGTCRPISGATVEIWHADAEGTYSGFDAASTTGTRPPPGGEGGPPSAPGPPGGGSRRPPAARGQAPQRRPPSSTRFLRGAQRTGRDGRVTFRTIFPGWYEARAAHVHVKVHVAGDEVHTGQLFFPDATSTVVYGRGAYASRGQADATNETDAFFTEAGGERAIARLRRTGTGYAGEMALRVRA